MPTYGKVNPKVRDNWQTVLEGFCKDLCGNPTKWSFSYFVLLTHEYIQVCGGGEAVGCFETDKGKRNVTLTIQTTKRYFRGKLAEGEIGKVNSFLFSFKSLADSIRHESIKLNIVGDLLSSFVFSNYKYLSRVVGIMFPENTEVSLLYLDEVKLRTVFNKAFGIEDTKMSDECKGKVLRLLSYRDKDGGSRYSLGLIRSMLKNDNYPEYVINDVLMEVLKREHVYDTNLCGNTNGKG